MENVLHLSSKEQTKKLRYSVEATTGSWGALSEHGTIEDAKKAIEEQEEDDRAQNCYAVDYYCIRDTETDELI